MKHSVIICDDNPVHLSYLQQTIVEYDKTGTLNVHRYSDALELDKDLDTLEIDIAFLDVALGTSNGILVGKKIKELNPTAAIIFVTGFATFAVAAFELRATHYLVKPAMAHKIHTILDEVLETLPALKEAAEKKRSFTIETKKRYIRLDYDNIIYFEKDQRKVTVHTQVNQYNYYGTFKELKKLLDTDETFVQCHQGFIVNINRILEICSMGLRMPNNKWIPVSRRFRSIVESEFEKVMFSEGV